MMKIKRSALLLLALLLCAVPLLSSCETSVFGSSLTFVMEMPEPAENDRYLIWEGHTETVLVDKETGTVYPLQYEKSSRVEANVSADYRYTSEYAFTDEAIEWHTHLAVPKYDPDTGAVSHYLYYPTVIFFDYTGMETRREESEAELSEEEVQALMNAETAVDLSRFFYAEEVGSGRAVDEEAESEPTYTDLQQKAVDHALSLENDLRGEYHLTFGEGFEQDGKVYFSVTRSNQKGWGSQTATVQGIYHSAVICYDPEADTFETLFESKKSLEILLFDTDHALVLDGNTLRSYSFGTGKSEKICKLENDAYYSFECSDGILHLSRSETIKGTPPDTRGYASFSYPCELHVFITPDGTVLAEDYDLGPEEKENVTGGSDITYQGW